MTTAPTTLQLLECRNPDCPRAAVLELGPANSACPVCSRPRAAQGCPVWCKRHTGFTHQAMLLESQAVTLTLELYTFRDGFEMHQLVITDHAGFSAQVCTTPEMVDVLAALPQILENLGAVQIS